LSEDGLACVNVQGVEIRGGVGAGLFVADFRIRLRVRANACTQRIASHKDADRARGL